MTRIDFGEVIERGWENLLTSLCVCWAVAYALLSLVVADLVQVWPWVKIPQSVMVILSFVVGVRAWRSLVSMYFDLVVRSDPRKGLGEEAGEERRIRVNWVSQDEE